MKKTAKITASIVLICWVFVATKPATDRYFEVIKNLDIFAVLFKEINNLYVDEINPGTLIKTGIDQMLTSLDPYTNYIPAEEIENYRILTTGVYSGIGALIKRKNGITTIVLPYEGLAAHEAGLRAGDEIHKIEGKSVVGLSEDEVQLLMKGQTHSKINLTIKRPAEEELFDVIVKRGKITIKSVPYSGMLSDSIGYVKLTSFTQNAGRMVGIETLNLIEQGAKGMILDLRGNPGGLLHEAVNVSNIFIEKGEKIVTQKGKLESSHWTYNTLNDVIDHNIPLAILIDNGSASASEIVSGVVQDYDRGILIGKKTFGKGLVQIERPLSYGSIAKITTAKYYTPTGRCIQAIDYSNRNSDGSVGKIPDSLKNKFKTTNGRFVYDGGGIDPDIEVDGKKSPTIVNALIKDDHIFDYATHYYYAKNTIVPKKPEDVKISDKMYDDFMKWLATRNLHYSSETEMAIATLIEKAKKEKVYEQVKKQIDDLKKHTKSYPKKDLELFKDEIKRVLSLSIISRYFYQKGVIESSFQYDQVVQSAISLLNDQDRYSEILQRN